MVSIGTCIRLWVTQVLFLSLEPETNVFFFFSLKLSLSKNALFSMFSLFKAKTLENLNSICYSLYSV